MNALRELRIRIEKAGTGTMIGDHVRFSILGRLEVTAGGTHVPLDGIKPRVLLSTLLLNANRTVPSDVLVRALWPSGAPSSALANLRTHVSTLRRSSPALGDRILTERTGYSISVAPEELDSAVFGQLSAEGRQLRVAGQYGEALHLFEQALSVWRDEPLADLPHSSLWDATVAAMTESRRTVAEELLSILVRLGRFAEAEHGLRAIIAEDSMRESIWVQLMLALDGSGRRAEALSAYSEIRHRLVSELGIEPGPELRRIHSAILLGESTGCEDAASGDGPAGPRSSTWAEVLKSFNASSRPLRSMAVFG
ncbi:MULTISPECIES: BTAD domain-containing putative transcriptional regulator [unclassified Streptomyces]|uniref:AfsR/SARP family transcriptional regulator n=1 Tax=unclassified Streptomyces TaxID=2593676 RepID=UPI0037FDFDBE